MSEDIVVYNATKNTTTSSSATHLLGAIFGAVFRNPRIRGISGNRAGERRGAVDY